MELKVLAASLIAQATPPPDAVAGLLQILIRVWVPTVSLAQGEDLQLLKADQVDQAASKKNGYINF